MNIQPNHLSVPAHLLPPYDGDGQMHFGHFVNKVDASCLKSPPASRSDVWNINKRVKFKVFLSVLEKTLILSLWQEVLWEDQHRSRVCPWRRSYN